MADSWRAKSGEPRSYLANGQSPGTFIEGLAWVQRDFLPTLHLHHNGILQIAL
jgi:hypothetical protein